MLQAILYLLAIAGAEVVTVLVQPLWGVIIYIGLLIALLIHAAVSNRYYPDRLLMVLSLVPLIRIISLAMPLSSIPQIWWYPIIYTPILAAAVVAARILGYSRRDLGITTSFIPVQLLVGLSGLALGLLEYLILRPASLVNSLNWSTIWLPAIILLMTTGFVEEFVFRGILQRAAIEAFPRWGIVYISAIFAILHIGFLSWMDMVFVFAVALFFGWVVKRTGSLLGVALSHGITNIMLFLVLPLLLG